MGCFYDLFLTDLMDVSQKKQNYIKSIIFWDVTPRSLFLLATCLLSGSC
jgi:hypothetical protein